MQAVPLASEAFDDQLAHAVVVLVVSQEQARDSVRSRSTRDVEAPEQVPGLLRFFDVLGLVRWQVVTLVAK